MPKRDKTDWDAIGQAAYETAREAVDLDKGNWFALSERGRNAWTASGMAAIASYLRLKQAGAIDG